MDMTTDEELWETFRVIDVAAPRVAGQYPIEHTANVRDVAEGGQVIQRRSVTLTIRDASTGNLTLRTLTHVPTAAEAGEIVADMRREAVGRAKATRSRKRVERDLDRE